jgi:hypothetical protein
MTIYSRSEATRAYQFSLPLHSCLACDHRRHGNAPARAEVDTETRTTTRTATTPQGDRAQGRTSEPPRSAFCIVYGHSRLFELDDGIRTRYGADALGSTRRTLNSAGNALSSQWYDAWGLPRSPLATPFGFTGEPSLQC